MKLQYFEMELCTKDHFVDINSNYEELNLQYSLCIPKDHNSTLSLNNTYQMNARIDISFCSTRYDCTDLSIK